MTKTDLIRVKDSDNRSSLFDVKSVDAGTIIKNYEEIVENGFHHHPHIFQRKLIQGILNAFAEDLVGSVLWERDGDNVCAMRKWTHVIKFVIAMAPRRLGLSFSLCVYVSCFIELLLISQ